MAGDWRYGAWDQMKSLRSIFAKFRELFHETAPPAGEMAARLRLVERDIVLPVKGVALGILLYSLYRTRWFEDQALNLSVAHAVFERFVWIYVAINVAMAALLIFSRPLPSVWMQRVIFAASFVDGLFLAALTFSTGGFDSMLYWLFLGLVVRNAVSLPLAGTQLVLNFLLSACYFLAGALYEVVARYVAEDQVDPNPAEPFLLRIFVLWLMTLCCYGVQVLLRKQRLAGEESREFSARQKQLHAAGRLAAQIAHQIKNPLGIINNAAFSLQKSLRQETPSDQKQVAIIREEVQRADRIITRLMNYAQLAEGKVEKLKLPEALDRAIHDAFPPGAAYETVIERNYAEPLPWILMQRGHLSEILVNLLTNAREALHGKGTITVTARVGVEDALFIVIADNGPGIAPEHRDKVFQAYFSTKEKGTGLGLAIVKHNVELYGGTVRVESELGKGTRFVISLPTRTFFKLRT